MIAQGLIEIDATNGSSERCVGMAPGSGKLFPILFVLDIGRLVLVWMAYTRLRAAYGGKRAIAALDALRLDVADGKLDGTVNVGALRDDPRGARPHLEFSRPGDAA